MAELSAADVIRILGLKPHPEGGHYLETFRDDRGDGMRAASTAIYFLLAAGEVSRWHRVDAAEVWHWHGGAPLALSVAPPDGHATDIRLGADLAAGERPQGVVPPGHWQSAISLGAWTLVGCTVAPGFEFAQFELAEEGFSLPRR
ncbi:MAG: cupin domain-containing protein [Hyphomicrobium sp.]|nr:cupin domain-containing protein [Hyphomicrobium sp.]